jgi:hypothetical protein
MAGVGGSVKVCKHTDNKSSTRKGLCGKSTVKDISGQVDIPVPVILHRLNPYEGQSRVSSGHFTLASMRYPLQSQDRDQAQCGMK